MKFSLNEAAANEQLLHGVPDVPKRRLCGGGTRSQYQVITRLDLPKPSTEALAHEPFHTVANGRFADLFACREAGAQALAGPSIDVQHQEWTGVGSAPATRPSKVARSDDPVGSGQHEAFSNGDAMAALEPPGPQDGSTGLGRHSGTEAMCPLSRDTLRLPGSLHGSSSIVGRQQKAQQIEVC